MICTLIPCRSHFISEFYGFLNTIYTLQCTLKCLTNLFRILEIQYHVSTASSITFTFSHRSKHSRLWDTLTLADLKSREKRDLIFGREIRQRILLNIDTFCKPQRKGHLNLSFWHNLHLKYIMKSLLSAIFMVVCAQVSAIWPRGQYCLPMPSNQRCPLGWDDGYSFQTTEGNNSVQGAVPYVATRGQDLGWGFCCKTRVRYSSRRSWPKGSYCIFRKGGFCPRGFMEGMTLFYLNNWKYISSGWKHTHVENQAENNWEKFRIKYKSLLQKSNLRDAGASTTKLRN